jgi:hypothetical protein
MAFSDEGKIGIGLGLLGLAGGGAIMVAPEQLWIGWTMIAVAASSGTALLVYHFCGDLRERNGFVLVLIGTTLIISGSILGLVGAFQMDAKKEPHDGAPAPSNRHRPLDEKLPGFASGIMVQTDDVTEVRKKYQYSFRAPDGAKVGFYLSASNRYALSVTDINGEEYKLDIPLGANGLPFGKWAYIFCEVGTASSYSYLRAVLNGKEVARRDFDFPLDLGSRQWMPVLGADASGKNSGAFMMTEMGAFSTTLSDKELMALADNALSAYGLKP